MLSVRGQGILTKCGRHLQANELDYMSLVGLIESGMIRRQRVSLIDLHRAWCQFKHAVVAEPTRIMGALAIEGEVKLVYAGILSPVLLVEDKKSRLMMIRMVPSIASNGVDSERFDVVVSMSCVATIVVPTVLQRKGESGA